MIVTLKNGSEQVQVELPMGTEAGHIRTLREELDEIGAPSAYTIAVNGAGVGDNAQLPAGAIVTFRPTQGDKGSR